MTHTANRQNENSPSINRAITFRLAKACGLALMLASFSLGLWTSTTRARTADDLEDLNYLYSQVLKIRATELDLSPPKYTHAAEALDYALRAIRLLEAGKTSSRIQADQVKAAMAYLYQTSGIVEKHNYHHNPAIKYYRKSIALDPLNHSLNTVNYMGLVAVCMAKYAAVAKKYDELPQEKRKAEPPDAEAQALLDEINTRADDLIDLMAHFLALADSTKYGETRRKVEDALRDLYKYRHHESLDGLKELIDRYRPA
jgi:tetratricopeptide (TPR) repeat protein